MIKVSDIWTRIQNVTGTCDETENFRLLNSAVELLSNEGDWDPLIGFADICTAEHILALPREVETPLAINIGGHPVNFRSKWFEFHLNGPGSDCCSCACNTEDLGFSPTIRRVKESTNFVFTSDDDTDYGAIVTVYGKDGDGNTLYRPDPSTGETVPGIQFNIKAPGTAFDTRVVSQVENIVKPVTQGFVTLTGATEDEPTGLVFGIYEPDETIPQFRRISVGGSCGNVGCNCESEDEATSWVRMRFRRKTFKLSRQSDLIFLHSVMAVQTAVQAVKALEQNLITDFDKFLALAVSFINKKEKRVKPRPKMSIQFQGRAWGCGNIGNMI